MTQGFGPEQTASQVSSINCMARLGRNRSRRGQKDCDGHLHRRCTQVRSAHRSAQCYRSIGHPNNNLFWELCQIFDSI